MASECNVSVIAEVMGLGEGLQFLEKFATREPVIKAVLNRQIQATAATEEALNLCGISTVELVIIKATANLLYIEANYPPAWAALQDYVVGDSVIHGGTRYICIVAHTSAAVAPNEAPATNTTDWVAMASTFVKNLSVYAGESRIIKPEGKGSIYINGLAEYACTVDYLIVGSA